METLWRKQSTEDPTEDPMEEIEYRKLGVRLLLASILKGQNYQDSYR